MANELHDTPVSPSRFAMIAWQMSGIAASALLLALFVANDHTWFLGFVALVPWLLALDRVQSWRGTMLSGIGMSILFELAVFHWFGAAFGAYVGIDWLTATLVLAVLAPLLQPQILAFVLVRFVCRRRVGLVWSMFAAAAAWVACEWLFPKLLGDTLGHGLQPSTVLRQMADLGGAAGLTVMLLLVNELLAHSITVLRQQRAQVWGPLFAAILIVSAASGYGAWRLSAMSSHLAAPVASVRVGLIQANLTDLERKREEQGAYAVIRNILDTHYMMSAHAVRDQGADVVLWSETIYPTTFGTPKSEDGAALDQSLTELGKALGVPLVFGTYDRDDAGEYNSAAFLDPERGLLGHYRKTYPFPLTESVPGWLDGPVLRRWLPWVGSWSPGSGARVFPLRTTDGREVNVVPLICLDDVQPQLAIDGARLGAQAILGLSNDSWFTAYPAGARLHLAVASFRSVETRLPQLRATTNGLSALIDETGAVVARTEMGQQAVLVGEIPIRGPMPTLMMGWGNWVGRAGLLFLVGFAVVVLWPRRLTGNTNHDEGTIDPANWSAEGTVLTPIWRVVAGTLRVSAAVGLVWLLIRMFVWDGFQVNSLIQIKLFGATVLLPMLLAWVVMRIFAVKIRLTSQHLALVQRGQRTEIPLSDLNGLLVWRLPWPISGVDLLFGNGKRWSSGLALRDPAQLLAALAVAGAPVHWVDEASKSRADWAASRAANHHRFFDRTLVKFVLFPLLMALPAFRLHQIIAFGGMFGEYFTYGPGAWLIGLMIWWAAWMIGLMLFAGLLRVVVEVIVAGVGLLRSVAAQQVRRVLEVLVKLIYFVGIPAWFLVRLL
ncbi:MAG: apolipoprotein N-acyltransferase [Ahniella sp.]|nr:apolipoprotein N-acyltransferase [Ahniella sp.]